MLSHITLRVSDVARSKAFFAAALAPLGYEVRSDKPASVGFGQGGKGTPWDFWIKPAQLPATASFSCLAFDARSTTEVDAFYAAALAAGGTDNGAPGYRPHYHAGYYAAFVIDPDGYNIEAVFNDWEKFHSEKTATAIAT